MYINLNFWSLLKRQSGSVVVDAACYAAADYFFMVYQSVHLVPALCDPSGVFSTAYNSFTACTSRHTLTGNGSTFTGAETPLSYCTSYFSALGVSAYLSSQDAASSNSVCSSYASIGSTPPANLNISCTQFSSSTSTYQIPSTLSTSAPIASATADPASTPTPSATETSSPDLSTGVVAGIAVGATIAGLVLLFFLAFFIWRRRRTAKQRSQVAMLIPTDETGTKEEKAQLHSESYVPRREELEGSKAPPPMRIVPGVSELEYHDIRKGRGEMSANEVAAPELNGSGTLTSGGNTNTGSNNTGDSTVVGEDSMDRARS